MIYRPLSLALLVLSGAVASTNVAAQDTTADRAKAFKLDSIAPATPPQQSATPTPAADASSPPADPTPPQGAATAAAALRPTFTLDTPIAVLIADPAARAVLDRDLPGMSTDSNLDKFASMGLRQFQPMTGGQLTDAMLVKVARDLSSLAGPLVAPIAPTKGGGMSKRNGDASR